MKVILLFAALFIQFAHAEIVELKIKSDNVLCTSSPQISVTQDGKVVYSFKSPVSSSAQVQLLTGTFQVTASNQENCGFQNALQISDIPNATFEIKLAVSAGAISSAAVSSPCLWGAYGCDGGFYSLNGNIMMAQTNIYLTAEKSSKFKIKFTGNSFNFLAAVPAVKEKIIEGEISPGSLYIEKVRYPYLFYAARVSDEFMQNSQAFCGNRKEITAFMIEGLRKHQFPDQSVSDFSNYLSIRMPEALKYCVFPQLSGALDKVAPLEITFEDKSDVRVERLFFLIVPQDYNGQRISAKSSKFSDKPGKIWKYNTRTVFSKTPYLYEWGVGFMFE